VYVRVGRGVTWVFLLSNPKKFYGYVYVQGSFSIFGLLKQPVHHIITLFTIEKG
jgi:hypothetical protein